MPIQHSQDIMCKAEERPQRRHRPMYVAPSAGQWFQHPQRTQGEGNEGQERQQEQHDPFQHLPHHPNNFFPVHHSDSLSDLGIPLLLEVPATGHPVVSPPSSGEISSVEMEEQILPLTNQGKKISFRQHVMQAVLGCYHGIVDFMLLLVVCFMGCFFYDVEVKVVKANKQRTRARGRSGRVIFRTGEARRRQEERRNYRGIATSLLRTPPRSASSRSPQAEEAPMWDNIV